MAMAMSAFVVAAVQAIIVVATLILINHLPFDDGLLGALGSNSGTCCPAYGAPDDGPVPSADGRTHGCPGAAADGAPEDSASIDAAGESRGSECGQCEECESLFACHGDPFV